jgi:eukaryotic-like serine/threonine-protein kinase
MSAPEKPDARTSEETTAWEATGVVPTFRDLIGITLGDLQVERRLGRGGMGEVYLARQISLNRKVALKVLRPDLLSKETYLKRFEAEATAVAKLNHPNIVHVYTLGCIDDVRFIAMEYVQGTNLRDLLMKKGALDLPLALSIMKQAGLAVGAAGELGLIHRDIKPENILLTQKGQVKITDFGLCRDQDSERLNLTLTGVTVGTPLYMSPEQARGHPIDHRGDLYSLGVTFYQMLAGHPPFRAETALAMALKHMKVTPVSLDVHRPDLPADVVRLVMKLMEKEPADRYQSAAEMLRDLAKIKDSIQSPTPALSETESATTASPAPASTGGNGSAVTVLTPTELDPAARAPRRRLTGLRIGGKTLAGVSVLCLTVGALAGWIARPEDLLTENAREPEDAPALWMVPGWESIVARKPSAEAQYHHALLAAPREDQEAAWVAVPGYFPGSRQWAAQAYIQLARTLLRHHDDERLKVLAGEIIRWSKTKTHEKELANIILTAVKALNGDLDGVVTDFNQTVDPRSLTDPALMELSLEVTQQAVRAAAQSPTLTDTLPKLRDIQRRFYDELFQSETRRPLVRGRVG